MAVETRIAAFALRSPGGVHPWVGFAIRGATSGWEFHGDRLAGAGNKCLHHIFETMPGDVGIAIRAPAVAGFPGVEIAHVDRSDSLDRGIPMTGHALCVWSLRESRPRAYDRNHVRDQ